MDKEYNVVNSIWFTQGIHHIGIVKVDTGFGIKYYMGIGAGYNKEVDEQHIAGYGARVHSGIVKDFLTVDEDEKLA